MRVYGKDGHPRCTLTALTGPPLCQNCIGVEPPLIVGAGQVERSRGYLGGEAAIPPCLKERVAHISSSPWPGPWVSSAGKWWIGALRCCCLPPAHSPALEPCNIHPRAGMLLCHVAVPFLPILSRGAPRVPTQLPHTLWDDWLYRTLM